MEVCVFAEVSRLHVPNNIFEIHDQIRTASRLSEFDIASTMAHDEQVLIYSRNNQNA